MSSAHRPRRGTSCSTRVLAPALALVLGLAMVGCRSDAGSRDTGAELAGAPTLAVEPVSRLGRVTGPLPRPEARLVEDRVSRIAVRWLTDAYVGGRYPRRAFEGSFADFSRGARAAAREDLQVMSNAEIGPRTDAVTPTRIDVEVDLLAVDRDPVGATAHVLTTFRTEGRAQGRYRVSGRLMLTKEAGRWTVFAYHVARGGR